MPVIVIANPKGGVGKSALATSLAGNLVRRHPRGAGHPGRHRRYPAAPCDAHRRLRDRAASAADVRHPCDPGVFAAAVALCRPARHADAGFSARHPELRATCRNGATLRDVAPSRVERDIAQWQDLLHWIDE